MSEKPDLKALEEVLGVVQQFRASERVRADIPLPDGSTMSVAKISGQVPGFRLEMEGGLTGRSYEPVETRPDDYPDDLPFVAGTAAAVQSVPAKFRSVSWMGVSDPEAARASIETQLQDAGWARVEETALPAPMTGMSMVTFRKGDLERRLIPAGPMLMLMENPA